jgi:hypothetical protein
MIDYPHNSAVILTDAIYTDYGGHTGTSTSGQRKAAYLIAEKQMTSHINTFLVPTTVTGTYVYTPTHPVITDYSHINAIMGVVLLYGNTCDCSLDEISGCAFIMDDTYGYIYPSLFGYSQCSCRAAYGNPDFVRVAYNAGYSSGTVYQADMLLALTMLAEINLNEIIDPGANEGTGDIGVQEFQNQQYSEKRYPLGKNAFGTSARAQKVANLVLSYQHKRALSL